MPYLKFNNRIGTDPLNERIINDFVINKGSDTLFISGGKEKEGSQNNLIKVGGNIFDLQSGIVDHTNFSIRMVCDSLVNFGTLGIYKGSSTDLDSNSSNDFIKFIKSSNPFYLITGDNSKFGRVRWNNFVSLVSDVYIQSFGYT